MSQVTMPFMPARYFDDRGSVLSGGTIDFFEAGSLTIRKDTYQDFFGSISNVNPVVLDAAGSARIFLGTGNYHIIAKDARGNIIANGDQDYVPGASGQFGDGTGSMTIVQSYDELRALENDYDIIVVLGREVASDGGFGIFEKQIIALTDDNGIVLNRLSTTSYKRQYIETILPEWYGVEYNISADQHIPFVNALAASVTYNRPLIIADTMYLGQNTTVPSGAKLIVNASIAGITTTANLTFASGSKLISCVKNGFATYIQPIFAEGTVDALYLSWFTDGSDISRFTKLIASNSNVIKAYIDMSTTIGLSINLPVNLEVDILGGSLITIETNSDVYIGKLLYNGYSQFIKYNASAYVGSVYIGTDNILPEWFGAVGDGIADDSLPIYAAAKTGRLYLRNYYLTSDTRSYSALYITGPQQANMSTNWEGGALAINGGLTVADLNVSYIKLYSGASHAIAGTNISVANSILEQGTGYVGFYFSGTANIALSKLTEAQISAASVKQIDCIEGSLSDGLANTTNFNVGINQVGFYPVIKANTGTIGSPIWPTVTKNDPWLIVCDNRAGALTINIDNIDPTVNKPYGYRLLVSSVAVGKTITVNGLFDLWGSLESSFLMGYSNSYSQGFHILGWVDLVPSPLNPTRWLYIPGFAT